MAEDTVVEDGTEWMPIKHAAEVTGEPERRIRFWKDSEKIRSRTFEERVNAPVFVAVSDIEVLAAERNDSKKPVETLPVPVKVFEELQDLTRRLVDEAAARAKADTQVEFYKARVQALEAEKQTVSQPAPYVVSDPPLFERKPKGRRWYGARIGPKGNA